MARRPLSDPSAGQSDSRIYRQSRIRRYPAKTKTVRGITQIRHLGGDLQSPTEHRLQRLDTEVSSAVPQFRQRRCGQPPLQQVAVAAVDEPLKPAQRRPFVTLHIGFRQQFAEQERVGEGQSAPSPARPSTRSGRAGR
jgi:hypothetical protein